MTNEKLNQSMDSESVNKKRKLFMLDEAGLSKQSLQFGSHTNVAESMAVKNIHSSISMGSQGERPDTLNDHKNS